MLILAMPDFKKLFVVETDASGIGFRAVLMQEGCPIVYIRQTPSAYNRLKFVYERKLMAIMFVVQKWRHYLLG